MSGGNMIDPNEGGFMSMLTGAMRNPMFQAGLVTLASNTRSRQHGQGGRALMYGLGAFNQQQSWQMKMMQLRQQQAQDVERKKQLAIMNDSSAPQELRDEAMRNAYPDQFAQSQFAAQKPTSLQSNYEYQQQLPPDQQQQFGQLMQRPTTTVNVGTAGPKPESGMQVLPDPTAPGGYRTIPVQGSKEDVKRKESISTLQSGRKNLVEMISLIEEHGSEMGTIVSGKKGQRVAGRMKQMYGETISLIAAMNNMGVLQPGEMDIMMEQLPDPTTFTSYRIGNDRMVAAYQQVLSRLDRTIGSRAEVQGLEQPVMGPKSSETGQSSPQYTPEQEQLFLEADEALKRMGIQ